MKINDKISYIEASLNPLSADVGIVKEGNGIFLYDAGSGDVPLSELDGTYDVVLSHFHPDHIGNIGKVKVRNLYLSNLQFMIEVAAFSCTPESEYVAETVS